MCKNILEMKGILKVYPNGVIANKNVDFSVRQGEIHALLGENGAGKSTLMKILYGIQTPQEGSISIKGQEVTFNSSKDAINKGIGMVHQHFMLVPSLTIAENIVLGNEVVRNKIFLDKESINTDVNALAKRYNFDLDISETIRDAKVVIKQKVEILKVLYRGAEILILDEPTAILTPQETKELFKQLKILRDNGHTIIFITHKLDEVKEICDRLSIMNHGKSMGTYEVKDLSKREISKLMVGRDVEENYSKKRIKRGRKVLELCNLNVNNKFGKCIVNNVSFSMYEGEIVSIVGVEGNGQSELIQAITGIKSIASGDVYCKDIKITNKSVEKIRNIGVAHIPEDRMMSGISPNLSIEENLVSNSIDSKKYSNRGFMKLKNIEINAENMITKYRIRCNGNRQLVKMLSGGNIQKVVVARELSNSPDIIIANHPTRGIDIGSAEFIRKELIECRDTGAGVLLVTADLGESFQISDRIMVMYKGEIMGVFENDGELSDIILGEYMLGIRKEGLGEVIRDE